PDRAVTADSEDRVHRDDQAAPHRSPEGGGRRGDAAEAGGGPHRAPAQPEEQEGPAQGRRQEESREAAEGGQAPDEIRRRGDGGDAGSPDAHARDDLARRASGGAGETRGGRR